MKTLATPSRIAILAFTALYILGFGAWFVSQGNYEFVWYVLTMLVVIGLLIKTIQTSGIPDWVLWLLSIWGLLHMLGGGITIGDHVLYAHIIYPFHVEGDFVLLAYDQVVHAFGFGVAAAMLHGILVRLAPGVRRFGRIWFPALAAMGLSVVNEIIEFSAVLVFPDTWVGGYYNVSLDLVFNTLGAFIAVLLIEAFYRPKPTSTPPTGA